VILKMKYSFEVNPGIIFTMTYKNLIYYKLYSNSLQKSNNFFFFQCLGNFHQV